MGRVHTLTIKVHPSLILWLSIFFYLTPQLLLPFFLAAGFHELGHYLMLKKLKKSPSTLVLSFSGASMETPALSYREEGLAATAGPAFSFLLSILWPLWPLLGLYSLILGILNLLPAAGLDGARILSSILYQHASPDKAKILSQQISFCTCLLLSILSTLMALHFRLGIWPLLLTGGFLLKTLFRNQQADCFFKGFLL